MKTIEITTTGYFLVGEDIPTKKFFSGTIVELEDNYAEIAVNHNLAVFVPNTKESATEEPTVALEPELEAEMKVETTDEAQIDEIEVVAPKKKGKK